MTTRQVRCTVVYYYILRRLLLHFALGILLCGVTLGMVVTSTGSKLELWIHAEHLSRSLGRIMPGLNVEHLLRRLTAAETLLPPSGWSQQVGNFSVGKRAALHTGQLLDRTVTGLLNSTTLSLVTRQRERTFLTEPGLSPPPWAIGQLLFVPALWDRHYP